MPFSKGVPFETEISTKNYSDKSPEFHINTVYCDIITTGVLKTIKIQKGTPSWIFSVI